MAILLPFTFFLTLWRVARLKGDSTREAILRATVISAISLVFVTYFLSVFHLLKRTALTSAWLLLLVGAIAALLRARKNLSTSQAASQNASVHLPSNIDLVEAVLGAILVFGVTLIGRAAFIWSQNIGERIAYPVPGSLFVIGGKIVSIADFLLLAGSMVAVTLIAARLGANRRGQLIAAIFIVTLPESLLQSSSFLSTEVASFCIVTACFFLVRAGASLDHRDIVAAALATGLALLTTGVAAVYLPVLILGCVLFRPANVRSWFLRRLPMFLALIMVVNASRFFGIGQFHDRFKPLGMQAGNPVHFVLIVMSFMLLPLLHMKLKDGRVLWLIGSLACSFVVFSAFLRSNTLESRPYLPLYILSAATVGVAAERLFTRGWQIFCLAAFLLLLGIRARWPLT